VDLTVHRRYYVEIKCQLDATDEFLLQILLLAQHVSGTFMPIISSPQTGHTTLNSTLHRQLENQAPNTTNSNYLYNILELLMMGIKVPETC
jgi:membrane carboxypeptidase/penicillin-binding protein PbpC